MLGRLYAVIFICAALVALCYQKIYLSQLSKTFHAQLDAQNSVQPINHSTHFQTFFYKKDLLERSLSGDELTYMSNHSFRALGHLQYQEYNEQGNARVIMQSEEAEGKFEHQKAGSENFFTAQKKLQFFILPHEVTFQFQNNHGTAENVTFDNTSKTLFSPNRVNLDGPYGRMQADGFTYALESETFQFRSHVKGIIYPKEQIQKKKDIP